LYVLGPIGAVRIARVNGELIVNPTKAERDISDIDLLYAGTKTDAIMLEGSAMQAPEDVVKKCLEFAHAEVQKVIELQESRFRDSLGIPNDDEDPIVDCFQQVYSSVEEELTGILSETDYCTVSTAYFRSFFLTPAFRKRDKPPFRSSKKEFWRRLKTQMMKRHFALPSTQPLSV
jgi:hypothetical protein